MTKHENLTLAVAFGVGRGKNVTHWQPTTIAWWKVCEWVAGRLPATKEQAGGYVFGLLTPTPELDHSRTGCPSGCDKVHRNRDAVKHRSAFALDVDKAPADFPQRVAALGVEALLHTTASSTPDDLRLRLIIPTDQRMSARTFTLVTDELMRLLSREDDDPAMFDRSCNQPSRFMYKPAAPDLESFKAWHFDGELVNVAMLLLDAELDAPEEAESARESVGEHETGQATGPEREKAQTTLQLAYKSGEELANPIGRLWDGEATAPGRNEWVKNWLTVLYGFVKYGALEYDDATEQVWLASTHAPGDDTWDRDEFDGVAGSVWSYAKPIRPEVKEAPEPSPAPDGVEVDEPGADAGNSADLYDPNDIAGDVHLAKRVALGLRGHKAHPMLAWGRKGWAYWTGKKWDAEYPEDKVRRRIRQALLRIRETELAEATKAYNRDMRAAAKLPNPQAREDGERAALKKLQDAQSRVRRLRMASTVDMVLKLARADMHVSLAEFDGPKTHDWLNCANGMVDLRTGELHPHDPARLFTRVTPVEYDPEARHEDWDKALNALPDDTREWFQKRCGQAATGHPPVDDVVPFLFGGGENGKTTVLTGVTKALGEFYTIVPEGVLLKSNNEHAAQFMVFKGARLAIIEELPDDKWLDDARLKRVVGTEGMTAHAMREDWVKWEPSHSLMVSTNHETQVAEADHGTWRRLARLSFPYTFDGSDPDRPRDGTLRERLKLGRDGQHTAVLAWMVRGAVESYAEPLSRDGQPERVKADTRVWRARGNSTVRFADECLEYAPEWALLSSDVYVAYRSWAKAAGLAPMSDQTFWSRVGDTELFRSPGVEKKLTRIGDFTVRQYSRMLDEKGKHRLLLCVALTEDGHEALVRGLPPINYSADEFGQVVGGKLL